jgi:hypothetical protein
LRKTKQKYEHGGLLTFKINIFFHGDNSWKDAFIQTKFGIMEDHGHACQVLFEWLFCLTGLWIWRCWDFQITEVGAQVAPVNLEVWNFICRQTFEGWTTFKTTTFAKSQKYCNEFA